MPRDLKRYQQLGNLHFITFSCYHRQPFLNTASARALFLRALEPVRGWYGLRIWGYVVMPEHVHLPVSEPERATLGVAIQMLKQITSKELLPTVSTPKVGTRPRQFWQVRYYDFNVCTERKRVEKLRYMHRNPVNVAWSRARRSGYGAASVIT